MLRLIMTRVFLGCVTLFAVTLLIFAATEILPGDVASAVLGQGATPETLAAFRIELGLDRPAYVRYLEWLTNALQGDLGIAMTNKREVLATITPRLYNTLFLAGYAAAIAVPIAIILGIIAAINEGKWIDRAANILTLGAISVPEFFIAYILILVFATNLGWFPSLSTVYGDMGFWQKIHVVALPALTLTMLVMAHMLRMTRASVLAIMSQPISRWPFSKVCHADA